MKKLGQLVNIIPIIAKADTLGEKELANFKRRIMEDIAHHEIPVYSFPDHSDEDEEVLKENTALRVSSQRESGKNKKTNDYFPMKTEIIKSRRSCPLLPSAATVSTTLMEKRSTAASTPGVSYKLRIQSTVTLCSFKMSCSSMRLVLPM